MNEKILTDQQSKIEDSMDTELTERADPAERLDEINVGESKLVYDEDALNLVDDFYKSEKGKKELKKIASQIYDQFDTAQELSKEYRDRFKEDYEVLTGHLREKTFPWPDCANVNVPIASEGIIRLWSRIKGEILKDPNHLIGFAPSGPDDAAVARAITNHTNFQLRYSIPDFIRQVDRGIILFLMGDVTCHSYRDTERNVNRHEMLTPDEIIRPYVFVSTMPDYSDLPWIAKILIREKHWLQKQEGYWHTETLHKILERKPVWDDEPILDVRTSAEQIEGIQPDTEKGPYKLIQWEGWLDLPQQPMQRYVQIIMDLATKNIPYMTIHEMPAWDERERYDRQTKEAEAYQQSLVQYEQLKQQAAMIQQQQAMMQAQPPTPPPGLPPGAIPAGPPGAPPGTIPTPIELPPPPQPPIWMQEGQSEPDPMIKSPIYMFRHSVCLEPLVGNLGLGLGQLMCDYNRAANTVISQFVDSATANNAKGFLVDEQVEFVDVPNNQPVLGPGRMNRVRLGGLSLQDHIHEFAPGPGNPQMVQLVSMIKDWGESVGQAPEILSGSPGKSGETWRGVATRVEQAMKQISAFGLSFASFFEGIVENNAILNSIFLEDEEIFWVNDHMIGPDGTMQSVRKTEKITREMYARKFRVHVTSDMKFISEAQRIADSDQMIMNCMSIPQLSQNWPLMYELIAENFEARGKPELIKRLPPPNAPMPMQAPPGQMQGAPPGAPGAVVRRPPGAAMRPMGGPQPPAGPGGPAGPAGPAPTGARPPMMRPR